ncbi:MAG TPA: TIM44-like domain-containing protein [Burkholderiaceae bacterium]|nr:TIM44-like domain-containing protein [Burkholderiaceae bacterium]
MNKWVAAVVIGVIAATFALDADAQRRFGGGKTFGRQSPQVQQRQATPPAQSPQSPQAAPAQSGAQQAAPTKAPAAGAPATAARPASPWRGALMGLAAGLGIAALASWLGFGEALTMFLTVLLVGMALMMLASFLLRRSRPAPAPAAAGRGPGTYSNVGYETSPAPTQAPVQRTSVTPQAAGARPGSAMDQFMRGGVSAAPWGIPAGFDTAQFLAHAKEHYARLQRAWDSRNLEEIAEFTTNDMFIALTHEMHDRPDHTRTEVVSLDAELLGIESSADEHVASVKFDGTLRVDGEVERVSEVWNLTKPASGPGGWVLAGIQQMA